MAEPDELIVDTTTRIFQDLGDPQTVNNAPDDAWRAPLWTSLEQMGLTRTWVPEALGGAGATMRDGFEVLKISGQFAVGVPLGETMLAGWLLSQAGIEVPDGVISVAPVCPGDELTLVDGTLHGTARNVPFAREARHLAVLVTHPTCQVALVKRDDVTVSEGQNLAREPADTVTLTGAVPVAIQDVAIEPAHLRWMGASVRAMQMAGALQALLDISVNYATERVAFGKPIGKFQAVQHNLARLAGETSAANAAANSAAFSIDQVYADGGPGAFGENIFMDVAAAKIRVGEAAGEGAMIAHQAHGAIGYTMEHILHRYSHRLWSWRDEFGDETVWSAELGYKVAAIGADDFWPTLTAL